MSNKTLINNKNAMVWAFCEAINKDSDYNLNTENKQDFLDEMKDIGTIVNDDKLNKLNNKIKNFDLYYKKETLLDDINKNDELQFLCGWNMNNILIFYEIQENKQFTFGLINYGYGIELHGILDDKCYAIILYKNRTKDQIIRFFDNYFDWYKNIKNLEIYNKATHKFVNSSLNNSTGNELLYEIKNIVKTYKPDNRIDLSFYLLLNYLYYDQSQLNINNLKVNFDSSDIKDREFVRCELSTRPSDFDSYITYIEYKMNNRNDFDKWFDNIKNILKENICKELIDDNTSYNFNLLSYIIDTSDIKLDKENCKLPEIRYSSSYVDAISNITNEFNILSPINNNPSLTENNNINIENRISNFIYFLTKNIANTEKYKELIKSLHGIYKDCLKNNKLLFFEKLYYYAYENIFPNNFESTNAYKGEKPDVTLLSNDDDYYYNFIEKKTTMSFFHSNSSIEYNGLLPFHYIVYDLFCIMDDTEKKECINTLINFSYTAEHYSFYTVLIITLMCIKINMYGNSRYAPRESYNKIAHIDLYMRILSYSTLSFFCFKNTLITIMKDIFTNINEFPNVNDNINLTDTNAILNVFMVVFKKIKYNTIFGSATQLVVSLTFKIFSSSIPFVNDSISIKYVECFKEKAPDYSKQFNNLVSPLNDIGIDLSTHHMPLRIPFLGDYTSIAIMYFPDCVCKNKYNMSTYFLYKPSSLEELNSWEYYDKIPHPKQKDQQSIEFHHPNTNYNFNTMTYYNDNDNKKYQKITSILNYSRSNIMQINKIFDSDEKENYIFNQYDHMKVMQWYLIGKYKKFKKLTDYYILFYISVIYGFNNYETYIENTYFINQIDIMTDYNKMIGTYPKNILYKIVNIIINYYSKIMSERETININNTIMSSIDREKFMVNNKEVYEYYQLKCNLNGKYKIVRCISKPNIFFYILNSNETKYILKFDKDDNNNNNGNYISAIISTYILYELRNIYLALNFIFTKDGSYYYGIHKKNPTYKCKIGSTESIFIKNDINYDIIHPTDIFKESPTVIDLYKRMTHCDISIFCYKKDKEYYLCFDNYDITFNIINNVIHYEEYTVEFTESPHIFKLKIKNSNNEDICSYYYKLLCFNNPNILNNMKLIKINDIFACDLKITEQLTYINLIKNIKINLIKNNAKKDTGGVLNWSEFINNLDFNSIGYYGHKINNILPKNNFNNLNEYNNLNEDIKNNLNEDITKNKKYYYKILTQYNDIIILEDRDDALLILTTCLLYNCSQIILKCIAQIFIYTKIPVNRNYFANIKSLFNNFDNIYMSYIKDILLETTYLSYTYNSKYLNHIINKYNIDLEIRYWHETKKNNTIELLDNKQLNLNFINNYLTEFKKFQKFLEFGNMPTIICLNIFPNLNTLPPNSIDLILKELIPTKYIVKYNVGELTYINSNMSFIEKNKIKLNNDLDNYLEYQKIKMSTDLFYTNSCKSLYELNVSQIINSNVIQIADETLKIFDVTTSSNYNIEYKLVDYEALKINTKIIYKLNLLYKDNTNKIEKKIDVKPKKFSIDKKIFTNLVKCTIIGFDEKKPEYDYNIKTAEQMQNYLCDDSSKEIFPIYELLMGSGKTSILTSYLILLLINFILNRQINKHIYIVMPAHLVNASYNILIKHIMPLYIYCNISLFEKPKPEKIENEIKIFLISDYQLKQKLLNNDHLLNKAIKEHYFIYDEIDMMANPLTSEFNIPINKKELQYSNFIESISKNIINLLLSDNIWEKIDNNDKAYNNRHWYITNNYQKYNKMIQDLYDSIIEEDTPECIELYIKSLLPILFTYQYNYNFGLPNSYPDGTPETYKYKAIPYTAGDSPAYKSEFSDPILTYMLTYYSYKILENKYEDRYYYRKNDIKNFLKKMIDNKIKIDELQKYFTKDNAPASIGMYLDYSDYYLSYFNYATKIDELIYNEVVNDILTNLLSYNKSSKNISFTDLLLTRNVKKFVGFTGTAYINDNLPTDIKKSIQFSSKPVVYATIEYKNEQLTVEHIIKNIIKNNVKNIIHYTNESIINDIFENINDYQVLIDIGALLINVDINIILEKITEKSKKNIDYIIYFNSSGMQIWSIITNTYILSLPHNYTKNQPDNNKIFFYFSNRYITGVDAKQIMSSNAHGLVIIKNKTLLRDFSQGIFRMREIYQGQTCDIVSSYNQDEKENLFNTLKTNQIEYNKITKSFASKQNISAITKENLYNSNQPLYVDPCDNNTEQPKLIDKQTYDKWINTNKSLLSIIVDYLKRNMTSDIKDIVTKLLKFIDTNNLSVLQNEAQEEEQAQEQKEEKAQEQEQEQKEEQEQEQEMNIIEEKTKIIIDTNNTISFKNNNIEIYPSVRGVFDNNRNRNQLIYFNLHKALYHEHLLLYNGIKSVVIDTFTLNVIYTNYDRTFWDYWVLFPILTFKKDNQSVFPRTFIIEDYNLNKSIINNYISAIKLRLHYIYINHYHLGYKSKRANKLIRYVLDIDDNKYHYILDRQYHYRYPEYEQTFLLNDTFDSEYEQTFKSKYMKYKNKYILLKKKLDKINNNLLYL